MIRHCFNFIDFISKDQIIVDLPFRVVNGDDIYLHCLLENNEKLTNDACSEIYKNNWGETVFFKVDYCRCLLNGTIEATLFTQEQHDNYFKDE